MARRSLTDSLATRIWAPLTWMPASAPATLPAGSTPAQLPEMVQALLADRFQVKTHKDKKEFPVYALLVAKGGSKLKETALDPDAGTRTVATTSAGNGFTPSRTTGSKPTN